MLYGCQYPSNQNRRKRRREDEARRVAADDIDDFLVSGDITTHHAKSLAQCAFDDGNAVRYSIALGNAATPCAIHANGMDFVAIGEGVILVRQIAYSFDRGNVAIHRIDAFKCDQFGRFGIVGGQQFFEMGQIIMAPHALFASCIADTGNHRCMVELVGINDAARQNLRQGRQGCVIRHIARGEQQCATFAVQVGEFLFQFDMVMRVTADVPRAA